MAHEPRGVCLKLLSEKILQLFSSLISLARWGCFVEFWTRLTSPILTLLLVSFIGSQENVFSGHAASGAAARHSHSARVRTDSRQTTFFPPKFQVEHQNFRLSLLLAKQIRDCLWDSGWVLLGKNKFETVGLWQKASGARRQDICLHCEERARAMLSAKSASTNAQPGMRANWTAKLKTYRKGRA